MTILTKEDLTKRVREGIQEQLGVANIDTIKVSSDITEDLDADSLDTVELIMYFEEEYGIEIQDHEMYELKTVQDYVNYLAKVLNITG